MSAAGQVRKAVQSAMEAAGIAALQAYEKEKFSPLSAPLCVIGERAAGLYDVWLEPVTGRTHQLRAHMADFGHPLLGDDKYGDRAANRRHPGAGLCLWHARLTVPADSPMADYRGRVFEAPEPEWRLS